jgi:epoxyqueuosine reductase
VHLRNTDNPSSLIVEKTLSLGATRAGIASIAALQAHDGRPAPGALFGKMESVLVLALHHSKEAPELDWWDGGRGSNPGNRRLMAIADRVMAWLGNELAVSAALLPYQVYQGGIFLKDAAVLAGLGVIGRNNLLVTPEFGPRVRLRAIALRADLPPTGPIDFQPCDNCDMPCWRACPQKAFREGAYERSYCAIEMGKNDANPVVIEDWGGGGAPARVIKYCRNCEFACPIGRD